METVSDSEQTLQGTVEGVSSSNTNNQAERVLHGDALNDAHEEKPDSKRVADEEASAVQRKRAAAARRAQRIRERAGDRIRLIHPGAEVEDDFAGETLSSANASSKTSQVPISTSESTAAEKVFADMLQAEPGAAADVLQKLAKLAQRDASNEAKGVPQSEVMEKFLTDLKRNLVSQEAPASGSSGTEIPGSFLSLDKEMKRILEGMAATTGTPDNERRPIPPLAQLSMGHRVALFAFSGAVSVALSSVWGQLHSVRIATSAVFMLLQLFTCFQTEILPTRWDWSLFMRLALSLVVIAGLSARQMILLVIGGVSYVGYRGVNFLSGLSCGYILVRLVLSLIKDFVFFSVPAAIVLSGTTGSCYLWMDDVG